MGIRIRKLRIEIDTPKGLAGTHLAFDNRLVVIRAENTSGKSTCLNSIMYGLGLEGMLGPTHEPPLPDALRRSIDLDGQQVPVQHSHINLEIENTRGDTITTRRSITGSNQSRQLIRVKFGPALSKPNETHETRDFFVRTQGAAQREAGFHTMLAKFIGIDLPIVSSFDGQDTPLYLECLFPFFFIEQLTGWRDVKARMPTYLQIPDMARRSEEFILKLDVMDNALRRKSLEHQRQQITEIWVELIRENQRGIPGIGAISLGIPPHPIGDWPVKGPALAISNGVGWSPLESAILEAQNRIEALNRAYVPNAQDANSAVQASLKEAERQIAEFEDARQKVMFEIRLDERQIQAVDQRISAINADLQKHRDEVRLRDRGAAHNMATAKGLCPTCNQPIKDTLLPQSIARNPMSLEQNISFLEEQLIPFRSIRDDSNRALGGKRARLAAIDQS